MILDLLRSPSFYRRDPWGFARNQIGHGYIIGGLGGVVLTALLGPWGIAVLLVVYAVWEVVQVNRYAGEWWDTWEDLANVLTIACAVLAVEWWALFVAIHAAYLLAGFLRRK